MKKVLVLMGAFLAFAACDPKSDCDCTISSDMVSVDIFTEEAATITEFQGTCEEVTYQDLTLPTEWVDAEELGLTLSCVDR
ncbi:MAG: hypothetical protein UHE91_04175 [Bacteroidales bacterium]|nr:hypothetical protein [Bacteroidales bacterium]